jgi:hypothetical protein
MRFVRLAPYIQDHEVLSGCFQGGSRRYCRQLDRPLMAESRRTQADKSIRWNVPFALESGR